MVLNAIHVYANAFVHEMNSKQDYNIKANIIILSGFYYSS